jgi:predicted CXXCH cytochrome family protein
MTRTMKCKHGWFHPACGHFALFFLLLLCFPSMGFTAGMGFAAAEGWALAPGLDLLTPGPGATVTARNPETHLVLRQVATTEASRVRVEKTGTVLEPVVTMEDGGQKFLHFRLPLQPGPNKFTIVPSGQGVEIFYKQLQADPNPNSLGKDIYLFHQEDKLPRVCSGCHDLQGSKIVEPVGIKEQTSCADCHQNVIDKGTWKHSTTINQQCLACHQQFVKPWRIGFPATKIQDICLACHAGKKAWLSSEFVHGPLNFGGCTLCHDPHGDNYRYQLWADGSTALCVACHSDMENLLGTEKPLPFVHGVIKGPGCVTCHEPHATDYPYMLRKPINELCVGCHTGLAGITRGHPVSGHPVSGPKERRRPGRKLTCVSCHNPHGSNFKNLLIGDQRGGHVCIICHR